VGTLGSVFRIKSPCWPSDNTLVIRARIPNNFEYLYFQLKQIDLPSLNRGSTQPLLTQTDLRSQSLIVRSGQALQYFSAIVKPIFNKIDIADAETEMLAATRDLLLPKLMSGEIRVKDAEKAVEAVA
jgi:type I restriction enzyme, S subunit